MAAAAYSAGVLSPVQEEEDCRDIRYVSMGQKKKGSKKSGGQGSTQTGSSQGGPQKTQEAAVMANGSPETSNADSSTGGQERAWQIASQSMGTYQGLMSHGASMSPLYCP